MLTLLTMAASGPNSGTGGESCEGGYLVIVTVVNHLLLNQIM